VDSGAVRTGQAGGAVHSGDDEPQHRLRKNLSALDLTVFGVGVIIGTGIFVLIGQQAAINAGPAIVLSFLIAGVVCALAALCYAEFASTVPVAGSAYTFSYATLGEFAAWIIGWDLCLELALGATVVARGWSAYLQSLFDLPAWLAGVAVVGTKLSGRITGVLVAVKVTVVLAVIGAGVFFIDTDKAVMAMLVPLSELSELTSIGTLFAFVVVSLGVVILRSVRPDLPRAFKVPGVPWLPIASVLACVWLMLNLPVVTWARFLAWMALGLVLYWFYGRRRSRLHARRGEASAAAEAVAPTSGHTAGRLIHRAC
jgi:amino acid transporter